MAEAVSSSARSSASLLRRDVLAGSIETLYEKALGYEVRPFDREMLRCQSAHSDSLQLAPRGYGKSTVLTIARTIYEIPRARKIRILICGAARAVLDVGLTALVLR